MTKVLVAALGAAALYAAYVESHRAPPLPDGQPAPQFQVEKYGGGTLTLSDLGGKVVMLDFWATWCPPCVAEMPTLVKLAQEYRDRGLVFLAANEDEPDEARAAVGVFIARRVPALAEYAVFGDARLAAAFQVETLPTLYFIGPTGQILRAHLGSASESELRRWIEDALALRRD